MGIDILVNNGELFAIMRQVKRYGKIVVTYTDKFAHGREPFELDDWNDAMRWIAEHWGNVTLSTNII